MISGDIPLFRVILGEETDGVGNAEVLSADECPCLSVFQLPFYSIGMMFHQRHRRKVEQLIITSGNNTFEYMLL